VAPEEIIPGSRAFGDDVSQPKASRDVDEFASASEAGHPEEEIPFFSLPKEVPKYLRPKAKREAPTSGYFGTCLAALNFSGRASRREYWTFTLINMVIVWSLILLHVTLSAATSEAVPNTVHDATVSAPTLLMVLLIMFALLSFLPSLAVTVRRLHDTGHTGWWVLFGTLLIVLVIVVLIFCLLPSQSASNEYGHVN
jgi:uncharacterized membrane protein YhaH (DUF805 family)